MAIIRKAKRFHLEYEVDNDPSLNDYPEIPVGATVFWNDGGSVKSYIKTESGTKSHEDIGEGTGGGGGGNPTYELPTDLLDDPVGGQLMKASEGKAVISELTPAVPAAPAVWEITINSAGVAGTPSIQASAYWEFADNPVGGGGGTPAAEQYTFDFSPLADAGDLDSPPVTPQAEEFFMDFDAVDGPTLNIGVATKSIQFADGNNGPHHIWFNVTDGGPHSDPGGQPGSTPHRVDVTTNFINTDVANAVYNVFQSSIPEFSANIDPNPTQVNVTCVVAGPCDDAQDIDTGANVGVNTQGRNAGPAFGKSIKFWDGANQAHYIWFNVVDGNGQVDPVHVGTGYEIQILTSFTTDDIAVAVRNTLDGTVVNVSTLPGGRALLTNIQEGACEDAYDVDSGANVTVDVQGSDGSTPAAPEIFQADFTSHAGGDFDVLGEGLFFNFSDQMNTYSVWFDVIGGINSQTAPASTNILIRIPINSGDDGRAIATAVHSVLDAYDPMMFSSSDDLMGTVTVTMQDTGDVQDAVDFNTGVRIDVIQQGSSGGGAGGAGILQIDFQASLRQYNIENEGLIGNTLDDTLINIANRISMDFPSWDLRAEFNPPNRLKIIAGDNYPGTQGNTLDCYLSTPDDGGGNITLFAGPSGELTGGIDGAPSSGIYLEDQLLNISQVIEGGQDWVPQGGDLNAEAVVIAAAMETAWVNPSEPSEYYSAVVNNNVITLTRPINGNVVGTGYSVNMWAQGVWSIPPDGLVPPINPGSDGDVEQADGPWIGKLVQVVGGVATIENSNVMTFTNDGDIPNGAQVTSSTNGRIKVKGTADELLGLALQGNSDGLTSLILIFPPDSDYSSGDTGEGNPLPPP